MDTSTADINRLVDMYKSGKSVSDISIETGLTIPQIYGRFRKVEFTASRHGKGNYRVSVDASKVAELYESGMSENAVAKHLGIARTAVRLRLERSGVHIRSQSESEALKWSQMSDKERANQVEAANKKIRSMPDEFFIQQHIEAAKTKQKTLSKVGDLEMIFKERFEEKGFKVIPQKAVYIYNIDLAIRNTAIEIHVTSSFPHNTATYRKRIMELLKRDWNVIYIRIQSKLSIQRAADKVSAMIDFIESNKPSVCQYGMVRGTGKLESTGCLNGDNLTVVDASDGFFSALK